MGSMALERVLRLAAQRGSSISAGELQQIGARGAAAVQQYAQPSGRQDLPIQYPVERILSEGRSAATEDIEKTLYEVMVKASTAQQTDQYNTLLNIWEEEQKELIDTRKTERNLVDKGRFEVFKKALNKDESDAKVESDNILNNLRKAQTKRIITEPLRLQFEATLREGDEASKQENRLALEANKNLLRVSKDVRDQEDRLALETYKSKLRVVEGAAIERGRVKLAKEKERAENPMDEFKRYAAAGQFSTVRDIAVFWAGKKRTGAALRELTELSAGQFGVRMSENWFFDEDPDDFKEWLDTSLPTLDIELAEDKVKALKGFNTRYNAEQALVRREMELRAAGVSEGDIQTDVAASNKLLAHTFPDEPSYYFTFKKQAEDTLRQSNQPTAITSSAAMVELVKQLYQQLLTNPTLEAMQTLEELQRNIGDIQKTVGADVQQQQMQKQLQERLGVE